MLHEMPLRVPSGWLGLLSTLQAATLDDVYLAGGALRDTTMRRAVKDLDVFVTHSNAAIAAVDMLFKEAGYYLCQDVEPAYCANMPHVAAVRGYSRWMNFEHTASLYAGHSLTGDDLDVNVIFHETSLSLPQLFERFDFGICQIGCGVDGTVLADGRFQVDVHNRVFTMLPRTAAHAEQKRRSLIRWDRLRNKYPDFKLRIGGS